MVEAGYDRSFVTPHIWPRLSNTVQSIPQLCENLQAHLDEAGIGLKLYPGGEHHAWGPSFLKIDPSKLVTYGLAGKYAIFDLWEAALPTWFFDAVKMFHHNKIQPILAHPERMEALQRTPQIIEQFPLHNLLLQCNLECLGDEEFTPRRELAERWLAEDRYFMLGSDLHRIDTLDRRLRGLDRAIQLIGAEKVDQLTIENPSRLIAP